MLVSVHVRRVNIRPTVWSSWVCFVFAFFFNFLEKSLMQCRKTESAQFRKLQIVLEITKCACTSQGASLYALTQPPGGCEGAVKAHAWTKHYKASMAKGERELLVF